MLKKLVSPASLLLPAIIVEHLLAFACAKRLMSVETLQILLHDSRRCAFQKLFASSFWVHCSIHHHRIINPETIQLISELESLNRFTVQHPIDNHLFLMMLKYKNLIFPLSAKLD